MKRIAVYLALTILILSGCQALTFINYKTKPDPPPNSGDFSLPGLTGPVSVVFDSNLVPHIQAEKEEDLYFAMGYIHARERLFQMELLRRMCYGTLSEFFGASRKQGSVLFPDLVATDRWLRTIGLGRIAEEAVSDLDEASRVTGEAYAKGVNAYIASGPMPIEFRLLEFKPQPWTVANSIALARLIGWSLSANHVHELLRFLVQTELGEAMKKELFPPFDHWGPAIISREDKDYKALFNGQPFTCVNGGNSTATPPMEAAGKQLGDAASSKSAAEKIFAGLIETYQVVRSAMPQAASNNWVVGPSRSESGQPILANDPHLSHEVPGVFYAIHIRSTELDAVGVSLPGVPAVVLGHNRNLAWAVTMTFADTQDIYMEKPDPLDNTKYLIPGGSKPYLLRKEVIRIREKKDRYAEQAFTLRFTDHGPVLNDGLVSALPAGSPLFALKSTMPHEAGDFIAMSRLMKSKTVAEAKASFDTFGVPIQNWLLADDQGHIGYYPVGKIPCRLHHDGTEVVPGWTGEYEWSGTIPYDKLPQLFDPASGLIVTANNKVVPKDDYPYPITLDAMPGYRAARIRELLLSKEKWTAEGFRKLQTDVYSKQAERLLPALIEAVNQGNLSEKEQQAYNFLKNWDREADLDSVGASLFFATYREAWDLTLSDDFSPSIMELLDLLGVAYGFFDRVWAELPEAQIFDRKDTPERESRTDILRLAFSSAVRKLGKKLGSDIREWRWGKLHILTVKHAFGDEAAAASLFNVGGDPIPGARATVWAAESGWGEDYTFPVLHGPVFRHVHDLGKKDEGGIVVDVGQSGWPKTPGYNNGYLVWKEGRLWPVSMDPAEYQKDAVGTLHLRPLANP